MAFFLALRRSFLLNLNIIPGYVKKLFKNRLEKFTQQ
jgi:hypothetical protein